MKPLILATLAIGLTAQVATPPQSRIYAYVMAPGATAWTPVGQVIVDNATLTRDAAGAYHLGTACAPVVTVTRAACSGVVIGPTGTKGDCAGMQMISLALPDGSRRGPYIALVADPADAANAGWHPIAVDATP